MRPPERDVKRWRTRTVPGGKTLTAVLECGHTVDVGGVGNVAYQADQRLTRTMFCFTCEGD